MNIKTLKLKISTQLEETYQHMVNYGEQEGIENPTRSKYAAEGYDYEAGFYEGLNYTLTLFGQLNNPLDDFQNLLDEQKEKIQSEYNSLKEASADKTYENSNPDVWNELFFLDGRLAVSSAALV